MALTKEQINKLVTILITALIAILGTIWGVNVTNKPEATPVPVPTVAATATATDEVIDMDAFTSFAIRERIAFDARDDAYFYNGADLYFYSDDHATQTLLFDGATGDVDVGGNATFNALAIVASTAFTPTAGQTLTPTASMYVVNSSAAVSMTLAVCGTDGKLLYLYGDDDNTVTVNDTNIRSTDGNAVTFGQYDVVAWICRGDDWIHVSKSANQ